jgi:hypothetical protein
MKLVVNTFEPKKITPSKAVEKNVEWVVFFAVSGVKPIVVEAASCIEDAVGSDMVKFYRAGEKTTCAMFNASQILSIFQKGCIKKGR